MAETSRSIDAAQRAAIRCRTLSPMAVRRFVDEQIAAAHREQGAGRVVALDFVARLVTELRERRIWPRR